MKISERDFFDEQVQWVLDRLPEEVHAVLEEIPLLVEDRPSREIMRDMNISHPLELCGCFVGYPLEVRRSANHTAPTLVMLFREGVTEKAFEIAGKENLDELRNQIRITILHELAHFHGFDEDQLDALGYG